MLKRDDLVFTDEKQDDKGITHYKLIHTADGGKCPVCGSKEFYANDRTDRKLVSVGPDGQKVFFDVTVTRYKCKHCGKTWYPELTSEGRYTELFKNTIVEGALLKGRTLMEMAQQYEIPYSAALKAFNWYMSEREEKQVYSLPEEILLSPVQIRNKRMIFLIDPSRLTLLDILTPENFSELKAEGVKKVFLTSPELEKKARKVFSDASISLEKAGFIQAGLDILIEEGVNAGLSRKNLLEYLKTGNEDLLGKLVRQSIKILPVKVAYDFLMENGNNIPKLKTYDGELENFSRYVKSLKDDGGMLRPKEMEYITKMVDALKQEVEYFASRKFTADNIRKIILFNELSCYPLEDSNVKRNFGRMLKAREIFKNKEK